VSRVRAVPRTHPVALVERAVQRLPGAVPAVEPSGQQVTLALPEPAGGPLHRIEDTVVRQEVQAAGFVLDAESNLLRHPADDHSAKVQETGIRGKTDQFILKFRKPR